MSVTLKPPYRALAMGGTAAAVVAGVFTLGIGAGNAAPSPAGQSQSGATLAAATAGPGRITVTGTGTVNGTPDQVVLSMGVQVNGATVGSALTDANRAVSRVTAALKAHGVAAADIQTSNLGIQPNFRGNSQTPDGYGVSESLTVTLRHFNAAGADISAAVRAGGNAATVDGVSLRISDTGSLLARARSTAVANAKVKAVQYASASGLSLGSVVGITDQSASQPIVPFAAGAEASAPSAAVPLSAGTEQVRASVTIVYSAS